MRTDVHVHSRAAQACRFALSLVLLSAIGLATASGQTRNDLVTGFRSVPQEAQPRVWWHWMNANVTKSGIAGT